MEDYKASSFEITLLDNIAIPINISLLSTRKALNSKSDKENTSTNDSHVIKTEEFLNQHYDYAALVHLKNQITKEISEERKHYRCKIKRNSPVAYEVIFSLRSQTETLQSEVHFLRN